MTQPIRHGIFLGKDDARVSDRLVSRLRREDAHAPHGAPLLARDALFVPHLDRRAHQTVQADVLLPAFHAPHRAPAFRDPLHQSSQAVAEGRDHADTGYDDALQ